jgi:hypothetical protein
VKAGGIQAGFSDAGCNSRYRLNVALFGVGWAFSAKKSFFASKSGLPLQILGDIV